MATKNKIKNPVRHTKPTYSEERPIITTFYGRSADDIVQINRSLNVDNAVDRAFSYMNRGKYPAFVAEIYDSNTSELYSVIIHTEIGEIRTIFRRDPTTKVILMDFDPIVTKAIAAARAAEIVEWVKAKDDEIQQHILEQIKTGNIVVNA